MNTSVKQAEANLAELLDKALSGEEVIITKDQYEFLILPKNNTQKIASFPIGCMPDIEIAEDFNEFGTELQSMFGMKSLKPDRN